MADWTDGLGRVTFPDGRELIGASFRGVPFFVESTEREGGRRTIRREFPLREETYTEDLGRQARSFPVEGYVLGDDWIAQRDRLLEALETPGPGELIHPSYGTRQVICTRLRVKESTSDGRQASFGLEFEETKAAAPAPVEAPAAAAKVDGSAQALIDSIKANAAARQSIAASLPSSYLSSCSAVIQSAAATMQALLLPLTQGAQELAALKQALDNLSLDAAELARDPVAMTEALADALETFRSPLLPPLGGVRGLLSAAGFTPSADRPSGTTAARLAEQAVYDFALEGARTLMVSTAARLAMADTYDSYDAAVAARDALCDALDERAEAASDDDTFAAMNQLRADLVRALPGAGSDLPHLMSYTPIVTVPSLVLAHRIYGDISLEQDLVARNGIANPCFVPGGVSLEILSDGG